MNKSNKRYDSDNPKFPRGGEIIAESSRSVGPGEPLTFHPLEVRVYDNSDRALKAFRALVQKDKILSLYKEKQSYEKPSEKRRRKRNESRRKQFEVDVKRTRPADDRVKKERKPSDTSEV